MKILASDFDDTIYFEDDREKTLKNVMAIRDFISKGNIFCIITGRNYPSLKQFLTEESIPYSYLICEDGAKIFNNMDYAIDTTLLEKEEIDKIVPILDEGGWHYYLDDGYNETQNYQDCVKIVVECSDHEEQNRIVEKVQSGCNVHVYASRYHVNIIHHTVNKENALRTLFELEHLNNQNLYVIGDNENDYEMLRAFQGGVIHIHHKILDELHKKEYESLCDYIKELMKD